MHVSAAGGAGTGTVGIMHWFRCCSTFLVFRHTNLDSKSPRAVAVEVLIALN